VKTAAARRPERRRDPWCARLRWHEDRPGPTGGRRPRERLPSAGLADGAHR